VIVTAGALGDVFGRRKVFLGGLALFIASCALIALSTNAAGVVGGRMIQGASGATILACGMSLLSVAASGKGQLKAITFWGAASAGGGALGPLLGGVLVDTTGWQGLFWIDAAIAAACVPLTLRTVAESSDPDKPRSIDYAGTVLVALTLGPVVLALSEGNDWGWASAATLGCLGVALAAGIAFMRVESRVTAPLVDLHLLRNRVLVGATLAILIVAGTINGLMYVLSLYFQNPSALGMSAFQAGLATLPAAAAMIAITPAIAPIAAKLGGARAIVARVQPVRAGLREPRLRRRVVGVRRVPRPADRPVDRPRHRERPGVIGLDRGGVGRSGGPGLGDLEHGALRRRGGGGRRRRDDQQRGRREPPRRGRLGLRGACGRARRLRAADGDPGGVGRAARRVHAAPPSGAGARDRPRRGRRHHHPHDPHAADGRLARAGRDAC
jgi:MFS family permease